jgi:acetyl-CoA C-acetyltransferase
MKYTPRHKIMEIAGDLNKDNLLDKVIVTQDTLHENAPYRIQVFFKQPNGKSKLVVTSTKIIEPQYPNGRNGYRYGNGEIIDAIVRDGLQDPFKKNMMGNVAEFCATKYNFSREEQDAYAIKSYERAQEAYKNNLFSNEIIPVEIPQRGGESKWISEDDEYKNIKWDKVSTVKPAFDKNGTVTAVNASKINDGAGGMLLMSKEKMEALGLKPIGKIVGYADAEQDPDWFTTAPALAIPAAIKPTAITKAK